MATIILKATEKCNSHCRYCDVMYKKGPKKSMPLEVLEVVFKRIDEYLQEFSDQEIRIIWHGGEPLLLGIDYFQKAVDLQKSLCTTTLNRINHSIQTNLTCFNENYVKPLKDLGISSVGTSYDPEPYMRGAGKQVDSHAYNEAFHRGLSILERNGFGWGLIYVVTKKSMRNPMEIFNFLTNLELTGGVSMNPVLIYDQERKDIALTPEEYVEFLGAIFPAWWEKQHRYPSVEPFKSLTDNIIGGHTSLACCDSGSCSYNHINIAPNGAASQCGRSADWGLLDYGNIAEKKLQEILFDSQRDQLHNRGDLLHNGECKECRFWDICHGGCPLDAYSKHKSFDFKSEWCGAKRGFITKYFEPITGVHYEQSRDIEQRKPVD